MLKSCLQSLLWLLFSPEGRLSRLPFFCYQVGMMPLILLYSVAVTTASRSAHPAAVHSFAVLLGFLLVWAGAVVAIKRLHDFDRAGWWVLLMPASSLLLWQPLFWAALLVLALVPGTRGHNRFGPQPVAARHFMKMRRIDALSRDFAAGRITADEFNARRAEILGAA